MNTIKIIAAFGQKFIVGCRYSFIAWKIFFFVFAWFHIVPFTTSKL